MELHHPLDCIWRAASVAVVFQSGGRVPLLEYDSLLGRAFPRRILVNVAHLVETLRFKPEGRGFDTWKF